MVELNPDKDWIACLFVAAFGFRVYLHVLALHHCGHRPVCHCQRIPNLAADAMLPIRVCPHQDY